MPKLLHLLLAIFVLGCVPRKPIVEDVVEEPQKSVFRTFSFGKSTVEKYNAAQQRYQSMMTNDTAVYKKKDGVVKLPVFGSWPHEMVYADSLEVGYELFKQYNYLGQFKSFGLYVVEASFYDYQECYLVDSNSGDETTLWNVPAVSPNEVFFANISLDFGVEGTHNGFQVWSIERNENEPIRIEKHLEVSQQNWIPSDFVWETDSTLILKVFPSEKFKESSDGLEEKDFHYLRLTL